MKKFRNILALIAVWLLVGTLNSSIVSAEEDDKIIKVGITATYKPWVYKEGEEIKGIDIDILTEIGKRMGDYELEFSLADFQGMFGLLDSGQVDTIAQQITVTEERKEKYIFSDLYAYNPYIMVVNKAAEDIHSLEDMKGKKFVTKQGNSTFEFLTRWKEENDPDNELELTITDSSVWTPVEVEQADATAMAVTQALYYIAENDAPLKLAGDIMFTEENAFPFSKDQDPEFIKSFNKALNSMREDGTLEKIFRDAFNVDLSVEDGVNLEEVIIEE